MSALIWSFDPTHSEIAFKVRHMMFAWVRGRFTKWEGTLSLNADNLEAASVSIQIDVASIDTSNGQRDGHLKSPDFFDAENFPHITYRSTGVTRTDAGLDIAGELTIRDTTLPVALKATQTGTGKDPWGNARMGFQAHARVNRKAFGLTWNQTLEAGGVLVGEDIEVEIEIQLVGSAG
jgi:polyisoprenoid-binding protein YceI